MRTSEEFHKFHAFLSYCHHDYCASGEVANGAKFRDFVPKLQKVLTWLSNPSGVNDSREFVYDQWHLGADDWRKGAYTLVERSEHLILIVGPGWDQLQTRNGKLKHRHRNSPVRKEIHHALDGRLDRGAFLLLVDRDACELVNQILKRYNGREPTYFHIDSQEICHLHAQFEQHSSNPAAIQAIASEFFNTSTHGQKIRQLLQENFSPRCPLLRQAVPDLTTLLAGPSPVDLVDHNPISESANASPYVDRVWMINDFREWYTDATLVTVYLVCQQAGFGKTRATLKICNDHRDDLIACHFCNPSQTELDVILSLASQFMHLPGYQVQVQQWITPEQIELLASRARNDKGALGLDVLMSLARNLILLPLKGLKRTVDKARSLIVIDGLDEMSGIDAGGEAKNLFLDVLTNVLLEIQEHTHGQLRWLLTIRSDQDCSVLRELTPSSRLLRFASLPYLNQFVQQDCRLFIERNIIPFRPAWSVENTIQKLISKCQSNMRYLACLWSDLKDDELRGTHLVSQSVNDLPHGLGEQYFRMLTYYFAGREEHFETKVRPWLELVAAGPNLSVDSILDILQFEMRNFGQIGHQPHGNFASQSTSQSKSNGWIDDDWLRRQVQLLRSLFIYPAVAVTGARNVASSGRTIRPSHLSVMDWFCGRARGAGDEEDSTVRQYYDPGNFRIDLIAGHERLADWYGARFRSIQGSGLDHAIGRSTRARRVAELEHVFTSAVHHLIRCGRWKEAVDTIHWAKTVVGLGYRDGLMQAVAKLCEDLQPPKEPELLPDYLERLRQIQLPQLVDILKGSYATDDLEIVMSAVACHYLDYGHQSDESEWQDFYQAFLANNDYVERYAIAKAEVARHEIESESAIDIIRKKLQSTDLNEWEIAAYMIAAYGCDNFDLVQEHGLVAVLSEGRFGDPPAGCQIPIFYALHSALGDLLLTCATLEISQLNELAESVGSEFWNSTWPHIELDLVSIAALLELAECHNSITNQLAIRKARDPKFASNVAADVHFFQKINELLADLTGTSARTDDSRPVSPLIVDYLNSFNQPKSEELTDELKLELSRCDRLLDVIKVMFGHPSWDFAESAAAILEKLALDGASYKPYEIMDELLMADVQDGWRFHFGAVEATYLTRYLQQEETSRLRSALGFSPRMSQKLANLNRFELVVQSTRFHAHPCSRVRALCAENFVADLFQHTLQDRRTRLVNFSKPLIRWLNDDDCWVLEQVYWLFSRLLRDGCETEMQHQLTELLKNLNQDSLLSHLPNWYNMSRAEFVLAMERWKSGVRPCEHSDNTAFDGED